MIKEILNSYILLIKEFENKLSQEYNLNFEEGKWSDIVQKVPSNSKVSGLTFNFHGAGCRVEKGDIVCEFDYAPVDDCPVKFTAYKLFWFINSNNSYQKLKFTEDKIEDEINDLLRDNLLKRLKIGDFELDTYQISKSLYINPGALL